MAHCRTRNHGKPNPIPCPSITRSPSRWRSSIKESRKTNPIPCPSKTRRPSRGTRRTRNHGKPNPIPCPSRTRRPSRWRPSNKESRKTNPIPGVPITQKRPIIMISKKSELTLGTIGSFVRVRENGLSTLVEVTAWAVEQRETNPSVRCLSPRSGRRSERPSTQSPIDLTPADEEMLGPRSRSIVRTLTFLAAASRLCVRFSVRLGRAST